MTANPCTTIHCDSCGRADPEDTACGCSCHLTVPEIHARFGAMAPNPDPYAGDVAAQVARNLTVTGLRYQARQDASPEPVSLAELDALHASFAAVMALCGPAAADIRGPGDTSRLVADAWRDGVSVREWLWDRATALGVDPGEVTRLERALMALRRAEPAQDGNGTGETAGGPRQPDTIAPAPGLDVMAREFHTALRVHAGWNPGRPTADIPEHLHALRLMLLDEEVRELHEAVAARDVVKIADACADITYVIAGTAFTYGIPLDAVVAEVHRSNMTKVNTPDEAKLVKGPDYQPPRITQVILGAVMNETRLQPAFRALQAEWASPGITVNIEPVPETPGNTDERERAERAEAMLAMVEAHVRAAIGHASYLAAQPADAKVSAGQILALIGQSGGEASPEGEAAQTPLIAVEVLHRNRHSLSPDILRSLAVIWNCASAARYGEPHEAAEYGPEFYASHDTAECEAEDTEDLAGATWSGEDAPGGWVCAVPVDGNNPDGICGHPVESEPCPEHRGSEWRPE